MKTRWMRKSSILSTVSITALLTTSCVTYAKDSTKSNVPPPKQEQTSPSDIVDFKGKVIPTDDFEPVPESDPSFYVILDKDSEIFKSTATQDSTGTMLPNIPVWVKETILQHEQTNPTPFTLNTAELGKCQFLGIKLLLDNRKSTEDWGISTAKPCNWKVIPPRGDDDASRATIWIVRKQNHNTKVLQAGRGNIFTNSGLLMAGEEASVTFQSKWLYPNNLVASSSVSRTLTEDGKESQTGTAHFQLHDRGKNLTEKTVNQYYIDDNGAKIFVPWIDGTHKIRHDKPNP